MTSQELELLFKKMLKEQEEITKQDEVYLEDIKDFSLKVNWEILDLTGYQIFEKDNYSYKFGEILDEPDMTLTISDPEPAKKFLSGDRLYWAHVRDKDYKGMIKYEYAVSVEEITTDKGKKKKKVNKKPFLTARFDENKEYHPFFLGKIPMFRKLRGEISEERIEKFYGSYVPINQSLGTYENQVIPYKVFKHFIDKADGIVVEDICGCRLVNECKDHPVSIGCMHIGSETKNIDLEDLEWGMAENIPGRFTTKEEALERVRLAIESGLIPLLGSINPTGHMMSMCFCCTCCCVNGRSITYGPSSPRIFRRIEGLTVEVNPDVCVGCGDCLEVCVFKGMEMIDDKAVVNQNRCLGCGRCEMACPNEAISIEFDESKRVKDLIDTLETYADVS
jgi:UDP-glucose 4-epimerase